mmetsp:Transcript_24354/g.37721  ORF Transcript_24354/g.37721 Transcript_24354/m.37721 type:complete len:95 (+) Transcript_24354:176-460(+)|eukprot:CAMPEP_0170494526 /NCGR_PEP_ID=MMETSP0208-20121228/14688_1 /TAXON_ID=197538 /ORGANISM="Strombidium inclinatum, Strain S3" /LENGTH=94 /DNA_ID=CAMNT_0010770595 /DNA_START=1203 /DNA_END=1487 /DNA_ORIENTATION=-
MVSITDIGLATSEKKSSTKQLTLLSPKSIQNSSPVNPFKPVEIREGDQLGLEKESELSAEEVVVSSSGHGDSHSSSHEAKKENTVSCCVPFSFA